MNSLWEETENRYSDDEKRIMRMKQMALERKKIEKEYGCEYETFEQFWDDTCGEDFGYGEPKCVTIIPVYRLVKQAWEMGENHGYYLGKFFGNLTEDEKPRYFVDDDKPIGRPYHDDD